jgi:predicted  nucleic acid-binding Zn-ribbon protein
MSLASRLYQLQSTELQLRDQRRRLQETIDRLDHNEELAAAERESASAQGRLKAAEKLQRELEWEVNDLNSRIRDLNDRLYGGSVRNPKELLSLEQDVQSVKKHLAGKEELLLEAMGESESIEVEATSLREQVGKLRGAWDEEKVELERLRETLETEVQHLIETRLAIRQEIGPAAAQRYDQIAQAKGVAVVKVEQGRCKGCNLTVPAGQWQRARAGEMVECGSCGRLIYVE